ncbi:septation protein IspZ [Alphaproteobacteria bacterium KMM 3653]|uniref:Inner membrane-spanning protein YciB n=1 Tax=Harenicola maris TaxID=2841044 RepID=A0AAP2CRW6_9RHOB|nr:septation protein IspZ [Harenicola maris]
MAEKQVHPGLKLALEMGPIAAFFIGYLWLKDEVFTFGGTEYRGFIVVTAAFVPLILLTTGILWKLTGTLSRMQVMTAVLVTVMGGLTVALNDERFIKMKPTILYTVFAAVLAYGLMQGKSYLQYVMHAALPMQDAGWMILTKRFVGLFVGLAVANELVWRLMSEQAWVNFKTFGLPVILFAFMFAQAGLMSRYSVEDDKAE